MAISPGGRPINYSPLGPNDLWHTKGLKLPAYIRGVAHGINPADPEAAIDEAVASMKRWAAGGQHVHPAVRAAAAKALAEWEAAKAAAHALSNDERSEAIDLAGHGPYRYRHGWIPLFPTTKSGQRVYTRGGGMPHVEKTITAAELQPGDRIGAGSSRTVSGPIERVMTQGDTVHFTIAGRGTGAHFANKRLKVLRPLRSSDGVSARVSVRAHMYRGEAGHLVTGKDTRGRKVSVFVPGDRAAADRAVMNIRAGRSAFAKTASLSSDQNEAIDLARMTVHRKNMLATAARHLAKARKARAAGQHKTAAIHYRAARTIMTDVSGT